MKTNPFALAFACAFLFAACSSLPSRERIRAELDGFEVPKVPSPDSSMVYVVRPSFMGLAIPFHIYADDGGGSYLQGTTSYESYIYFELPPGEHVIISKVENTDKLRVVTKPGDIIFVEQTPVLGIIKAENVLKLLPDEEGRYRVKNLRLGSLASTNGRAPAAPSKEALAGSFEPSAPRDFPRGSMGVGFQRAQWGSWGPSFIDDVMLGGLQRFLSLETVIGLVPSTQDLVGSNDYMAVMERVYVRPIAFGKSSIYAVGSFGVSSSDYYGDPVSVPVAGIFAGAELDLRTISKNLPPISLNAEYGYEFRGSYYDEGYAYPDFGLGLHYWFWF